MAGSIAALVEPGMAVLTLLVCCWWFREPIDRPEIVLCVLAVTLLFPGHNHFWERPLNAAVQIGANWATLLGILALVGFATHSFGLFDWNALLAWALISPALVWLTFFSGRRWLRRHAAQAPNRRRAVIVGAGPLGVKVAAAFQARGSLGHELLGYFDDREDGRIAAEARALRLGRLADVAAFVREHGVHEAYITLPLGSQPRIIALLESIQGTTASIYFVPDVFGISIIQGRLRDMNGLPVVGLCESPFTGTNLLVKRASDLLLSGLILALIWPLMLIIAAAVRFSSPGPAIFRQRRNGLDGEEIVVYKFRSMTTQDNGDVVPQARRDDPRVTRLGAFLRRTSLDELPQFINVLQGRMSIVGPRPHAVAHNAQYRELIKAYMVRHKVKPGITGWAQVNGHRGETDTLEKMQARVEYDLEYLRNWSLLLDLQIVARTIKLVFFDRKAY
ncbi:MAG TPA: undecaprenyl-phosphate glucose phosphotransferase [Rubrivivax sp.]|nr:undecaprenyl-phosphate glucose phosphotransferase [Burkholderiales bacterium]HNT38822.1 undecaprenyl-phosphate glucose phosphotransferase [Rubrivivax sp.]